MSGLNSSGLLVRAYAWLLNAGRYVVTVVKALIADIEVDANTKRVTVFWTRYHSWGLFALGATVALVLVLVLPWWLSLLLLGVSAAVFLGSLLRFLSEPTNYR